jgi:hypothetical protein
MALAVLLTLKGRNDARSHTTPRATLTQTIHIPYAKRTNMKRVGLWAAIGIGIGICITVGLLTVEPGYAEEKEHEPTCTLKTLKGRYLFGGIATLLPPAFGVTVQALLAVAGYHIFHGDGTGTDIVTASFNGVSVEKNLAQDPDRSAYDIRYTVNPGGGLPGVMSGADLGNGGLDGLQTGLQTLRGVIYATDTPPLRARRLRDHARRRGLRRPNRTFLGEDGQAR